MSSRTSPPAATSSAPAAPAPAADITVTFQDVLDGRAYIRIPPAGKLLLAHMAGAPWWPVSKEVALHGAQTQAMLRPEREKIIHGGSRLGKSALGGCEALWMMMLPGWNVGVTSDTYEHVGDEWQYIDKGLRRLFPTGHAFVRLVFKQTQNYHEYHAETIWGSKARGFTGESDEGGNLLGKAMNGVIIGEGSKVSKYILDARILRACNGALMRPQDGSPIRETGYIFAYTTPDEYSGCTAAEFTRVLEQSGGRPEKFHYGAVPFPASVWIREADVRENPHYDPAAAVAAKQSMSAHAYEEQIRGRMTFSTGRVWAHYDSVRHVVDSPSPALIREMRLGVGIDTGAYTAWVLAGLDRGRVRWALAEHYTERLDFRKSLWEFMEILTERLAPVFPVLAAEPDTKARVAALVRLDLIDVWAFDPASQAKLDFMAEVDCVPVGASGLEGGKLELLPSLDIVNEWFRQDRVRLCRDFVPVTKKQIEQYRWKKAGLARRGLAKEPDVREPVKDADHCCDAARFVWVELEKLGPRPSPRGAIDLAAEWQARRRELVMKPLRDILERAEAVGGINV